MLNMAPSMRPYLMRAVYEWCSEHGYTPYALVVVDDRCQVPREFVQDEQIVFNIAMDATQGLVIDDEGLRFKARFSGRVHAVDVPLGRVVALYARESAQGLTFELADSPQPSSDTPEEPPESPPPRGGSGTRPSLRRIK